ncbi:GTP1/OBG domain-containing protein [Suillus clintonianus]|uniref:GTP1/OBG domain-containing protein n=1 Tax=Suillus clintonianus TaxID=1904413 RepID=UPI001B86D9A6|nr:GTP1/OBG domain-containing protein [Suillus clintonianus]KAG2123986.1 GTP1/OBG domain-containing protein [Suillus clintonianus]
MPPLVCARSHTSAPAASRCPLPPRLVVSLLPCLLATQVLLTPRLCASRIRQTRLFHSSGTALQEASHAAIETKDDEDDLQDALRRKRKTEWKRRQGGQTFLDNPTINVRGGNGGDGCVAFHREKWKPMGPPSGGSGGRGGGVYILPTPNLTSLSSTQNVYGAAQAEMAKGHGRMAKTHHRRS